MKPLLRWLVPILLPSLGCAQAPVAAVPPIEYTTVAVYPHDPKAWTQGLYYQDGVLFESTGIYGKSSLRQVAIQSGEVLKRKDLRMSYFGEGLTVREGRIYQLTWLSRVGFIYDLETFEPVGEFKYFGEGWGLTHTDTHLVMSDGTANLRILNPDTFEVERIVPVHFQGEPVADLNELEFVDGYVYANVWYTDLIVKIDLETGAVVGRLDCSGLWPERPENPDAVLNGIAYRAEDGHFFITGKYWSKLFEIRLKETAE